MWFLLFISGKLVNFYRFWDNSLIGKLLPSLCKEKTHYSYCRYWNGEVPMQGMQNIQQYCIGILHTVSIQISIEKLTLISLCTMVCMVTNEFLHLLFQLFKKRQSAVDFHRALNADIYVGNVRSTLFSRLVMISRHFNHTFTYSQHNGESCFRQTFDPGYKCSYCTLVDKMMIQNGCVVGSRQGWLQWVVYLTEEWCDVVRRIICKSKNRQRT